MRIGIDARFFGPQEKGLGVYVQKLVEGLEKNSNETDHQFFIFLKKERFQDFKPQKKNFHKVLADYPWYGWREQFVYPFFLNKYKLDLMHFGHFNVPILYRRKMVVTIHDLILFHFPTFKNSTLNRFYYSLKLLAYRIVINLAVRKALVIIAISEFTKKDLVETLNVPGNKIKVIYQGCNLLGQKADQKSETILKKYGIIKPYILYVGNAYPHKNLKRLSQVFSSFKKKNPGVSLVLAGGRDYFYQRLEEKAQKENLKGIIFPGFIDESDLVTIYQESESVVFPSLYEGFGFPPLEALVCEKSVACSKKTSMPEILKGTVSYFDPESSSSMLNCLNKVFRLRKNKRSQNQKKAAAEIIKKFNWDKTAQETLRIYESVSKSKK
ncbi:MAG: glycosyltransferase family 4 protein [Candidatus Moranbacteria bacterium]|nr:glycosyltransferase family 4 protein [Candidatus Moranbacteria bacterium]